MKKSTFVRRLLAWTTAAVMLLSAVPVTAAFRDTAGHWAEETLTQWQDKGFINGYGDGGFQPNGTMTRAEFVKLVNRALGFTAESDISFSDVTESDWFYAEVARAVAAGYAQGSGGAFRPNQTLTRAEAAAMLARAANLAANETRADAFADAASIPSWAKGGIGATAEAGYMTGYPDGAFGAGGSITRAEAVVTLDRVLKSTQATVIEKAGTTLENETIPGNLVIAESVGDGNVTLKNVTVLGSLIVKGGGANSIYLDGVRVNGTVRLQKENVHLCLMGDTALDRVEIDLPCRLTQGNTFRGTIGTIVIDLEKVSNQNIQIEVPAKLVELLSRANVTLGANVETLRIGNDAEGARLEVKRGATIGALSIDARVALTGSGLVVSLVVSVSGVTISSSLSVKKTETEGGAKAPTVSGSGSGSRTLKEITGIAPIAVKVPYGTESADALKKLPAEITLNVKDGSAVKTTAAGWKWTDDVSYEATPATDTAYTATATFTVPSGYTYSGAKTATAAVTVKTLDTIAFDEALAAAQALIDGLTNSETEAAADPKNKIFVTSETNKAIITKNVRFTTSEAVDELTAAIAAANIAKVSFASQQACDDQTNALTDATAAFTETLETGTNTATDGYILQQVKEMLSNYDSAAYAESMQPLKADYTYQLYKDDGWAVPGGDVSVKIDWSVSSNGASYIKFGKGSDPDGSAKVTQAPTEPTKVTFTATITRTDTTAVVGTIDYTATIGAPISVDRVAEANAPTPQFFPIAATSGTSATTSTRVKGTVLICLNGAEAIKSVKIDGASSKLITMNGQAASSGESYTTIAPEVESGTAVKTGLSLTVSGTTGSRGGEWSPNNDENPRHTTGKLINISIKPEALELYPFGEDNPGWYEPTAALAPNAIEVWLLTPVFTEVDSSEGTDTRSFRIHTQYMPEDAKVSVAFAGTDVVIGSDISNSPIQVEATLEDNGIYLATFKKAAFELGKEYNIWCKFGADWVGPQNGGFTFFNNSNTGESGT